MHYRSSSVFSLGGWTPQLPTGLACPVVLRIRPSAPSRRLRGFHRLWSAFPEPFGLTSLIADLQPRLLAGRFRLFRFRSPLLAESFLFLQVTEMFQFTGFPSPGYVFTRPMRGHSPARVSPFGHLRLMTVAHPSPELFAVYRVLLRHLTPRHPPCALVAFPMCCGEIDLSRVLAFCSSDRYVLSCCVSCLLCTW